MIADIFPLPTRKKLGGPFLDADVWQNISRAHLLGCQLVLFGCGMTYALLPTGPRHDAIAIAEQMECMMEKMQNDGWIIGGVVTDNAGQCARARRILSLRFF
ncbi:uncharacterized protein PITG_16410 [Phytophthora infestans T30-4]|uniref:Uncharacterized protein n=1 Tax=Phytophthora infestans (strain T30-4) TaxID=403677 RepID=D0NTK6_PHYIT|nr:uncharacterized protein PITG_16410 [Phytophthora infestans T30-4]EEY64968.1 conserved hypothetical protein [Phytophthora infestans T30-4]|eukprot:XP_002897456.1 conserved hypothetical protein [Phytophthora infestans T30-4]